MPERRALYRANGRVKQAEIQTSGGYRKVIALKDIMEIQSIAISPSKVSWVRLTILDVYPGTRGSRHLHHDLPSQSGRLSGRREPAISADGLSRCASKQSAKHHHFARSFMSFRRLTLIAASAIVTGLFGGPAASASPRPTSCSSSMRPAR